MVEKYNPKESEREEETTVLNLRYLTKPFPGLPAPANISVETLYKNVRQLCGRGAILRYKPTGTFIYFKGSGPWAEKYNPNSKITTFEELFKYENALFDVSYARNLPPHLPPAIPRIKGFFETHKALLSYAINLAMVEYYTHEHKISDLNTIATKISIPIGVTTSPELDQLYRSSVATTDSDTQQILENISSALALTAVPSYQRIGFIQNLGRPIVYNPEQEKEKAKGIVLGKSVYDLVTIFGLFYNPYRGGARADNFTEPLWEKVGTNVIEQAENTWNMAQDFGDLHRLLEFNPDYLIYYIHQCLHDLANDISRVYLEGETGQPYLYNIANNPIEYTDFIFSFYSFILTSGNITSLIKNGTDGNIQSLLLEACSQYDKSKILNPSSDYFLAEKSAKIQRQVLILVCAQILIQNMSKESIDTIYSKIDTTLKSIGYTSKINEIQKLSYISDTTKLMNITKKNMGEVISEDRNLAEQVYSTFCKIAQEHNSQLSFSDLDSF